MFNAQAHHTVHTKQYTLCTAHMPIMYVCPLLYMHFFFLLLRLHIFSFSRCVFFFLLRFFFPLHICSTLSVFVFFFVVPFLRGICCSRCAVSRMSAAAAVTARCALIKCVGQNHRKSFRLVSHFRLVCIVCMNGSFSHSISLNLYTFMCVNVPFELLRLGQALFLFHYIFCILGAHIMCNGLHCIALYCVISKLLFFPFRCVSFVMSVILAFSFLNTYQFFFLYSNYFFTFIAHSFHLLCHPFGFRHDTTRLHFLDFIWFGFCLCMYAKLLWWPQKHFIRWTWTVHSVHFPLKCMHKSKGIYYTLINYLNHPLNFECIHFQLGCSFLPFICIVSVVHFPLFEREKKKLVAIYVYGFTMHILCLILVHWVCNKTIAIEKKEEKNKQKWRTTRVEWVLNQKSVIMRFNSFTVLQILIWLCLRKNGHGHIDFSFVCVQYTESIHIAIVI